MAQAVPAEDWSLCFGTCVNGADGNVVWHNRTATLSGEVYDEGALWTQIKATAYAGNKRIGKIETRTADDEKPEGSTLPFGFTMGDSNLQGGINRIVLELCFQGGCTDKTTLIRP